MIFSKFAKPIYQIPPSLRRQLFQVVQRQLSTTNTIQGGARRFVVQPSKFIFRRFVNHFHFYTTLTILLYGIPFTYLNIVEGPAELVETPPGYVPKDYECFKSPVTRWIARYIQPPLQAYYEKSVASISLEQEKMWYRARDSRMRELERERKDHQGFYTAQVNDLKYYEYLYDFYAEAANEITSSFEGTSSIRNN